MSQHDGSPVIPADTSSDDLTFLATSGSRRAFLRGGAMATLATAALATCKPAARGADSAAAPATLTTGAVSGGTMPVVVPPTPRESADAMDAMHE